MARVPSVTAEGFGYDPQRGELWFAGETAEAVLLELEARRRELSVEAAELDTAAAQAEVARRRDRRARSCGCRGLRRDTLAREASRDRPRPPRSHRGRAAGLVGALADAERAAERFDAPLRARVDAGALRSGELGDELRRLGAAEVGLRQELEEASQRVTAAEVELARIEAESGDARRRLEAAGAEPADGDDREELATASSAWRRGVRRSAR